MRHTLNIRIYLLVLLLTLPVLAMAQKHTISGYIKEAATGEYMVGANVYIKELVKGTSTNQYGFYSLTVDAGEYTVVVSYIGFTDSATTFTLDRDIRHNVGLNPVVVQASEFEVTGERADQNTQSADMGVVEMDIQTIKELPAFLGEVDLLKTIQLLPGVQSAGEGQSGFYVRGGGPDQNLVLLDESVVYNASHLFGFFSIFNSDAVKDVRLIKGGMPAQYGGRLASVLDVSMKEGNNRDYQAEGGIGLISSRLTLQGPLKKDTASFMVSARRTYIDVLAAPFIPDTSAFAGSGYFFYDLNGKANWKLSDRDRVFLSGYVGRDVFTFDNQEDDFTVRTPWGNTMAAARWNHLFTDRLFSNATLIFSDYNFEFQAEQQDFEFKLFSGIQDWTGKVDFNYFPNIRHDIKFGVHYTWHTFTPTSVSARQGETEFDVGGITKQYAHEAAIYINDEFDLTDQLRINGGLRFSGFQQVGPFSRFVKDEIGTSIDTVNYLGGETVARYGGLEPRLTIRYRLRDNSSIKAAYTMNYQYVHMASLSSVALPTDVWVPSSDKVKPQRGVQYAIGYFRNFAQNRWESSVELYYKDMQNLVEYAEGALPEDDIADNSDNNFVFGSGYSYGAEFFLKRRLGKATGWIGYTWSRTNRQFDEINEGREFPAKYDRRHDLSVVLSYRISKRFGIGGTFVYGTGNALTLPIARYVVEGRIVNEYTERNGFRMKPYHRMDIGATLYGREKKRFQSDWVFSVFNVYNRANPYFIYFDQVGNLSQGNLQITAKQVSLFPILPSVTWNFKIK